MGTLSKFLLGKLFKRHAYFSAEKSLCSHRRAPQYLFQSFRSTIWIGVFVVAVVGIPVEASVRINEIAWMGTATSANDEWIELYNDGSASESLTGWTLNASDGTPSITLSGTISAGGYYLLERTDDTTVPSISANLIFSGAIGNTGETFTLKDSNGITIDTVIGGADWESIGGDAETLATPQRTEGGWVTGTPTPKASSTGVSGQEQQNTTDTTSSQQTIASSGGGSMQVLQAGTLILTLDTEQTVIAGADTLFEVSVTDEEGRESERATYTWNFGNGVVKHGARVYYAYSIMGTYTATLSVIDGLSTGDAQIKINVIEPALYIGKMTEDAVYIQNKGKDDANIGGWKVQQGNHILTLPPYTILKAGYEVPLAHLDTGFTAGVPVSLLYPNGTPVQYKNRDTTTSYTWVGESAPISTSHIPVAMYVSPKEESGVLPIAQNTVSSPLVGAVTDSKVSFSPYILLWGILVLLGGGALFIVRKFSKKKVLDIDPDVFV